MAMRVRKEQAKSLESVARKAIVLGIEQSVLDQIANLPHEIDRVQAASVAGQTALANPVPVVKTGLAQDENRDLCMWLAAYSWTHVPVTTIIPEGQKIPDDPKEYHRKVQQARWVWEGKARTSNKVREVKKFVPKPSPLPLYKSKWYSLVGFEEFQRAPTLDQILRRTPNPPATWAEKAVAPDIRNHRDYSGLLDGWRYEKLSGRAETIIQPEPVKPVVKSKRPLSSLVTAEERISREEKIPLPPTPSLTPYEELQLKLLSRENTRKSREEPFRPLKALASAESRIAAVLNGYASPTEDTWEYLNSTLEGPRYANLDLYWWGELAKNEQDSLTAWLAMWAPNSQLVNRQLVGGRKAYREIYPQPWLKTAQAYRYLYDVGLTRGEMQPDNTVRYFTTKWSQEEYQAAMRDLLNFTFDRASQPKVVNGESADTIPEGYRLVPCKSFGERFEAALWRQMQIKYLEAKLFAAKLWPELEAANDRLESADVDGISDEQLDAHVKAFQHRYKVLQLVDRTTNWKEYWGTVFRLAHGPPDMFPSETSINNCFQYCDGVMVPRPVYLALHPEAAADIWPAMA